MIEEGLCGRTTIFDDPLRDGRRGTELLPVLLETHATVDGVVLMLGTNDCKTAFGASAEVIGKGIERLLRQIRYAAPQAEILLISPIYLGDVWRPECDPNFQKIHRGLASAEAVYETIAKRDGTSDFEAADYAVCSDRDQEHMNAAGHAAFAQAGFRRKSSICLRARKRRKWGVHKQKRELLKQFSQPVRIVRIILKKCPAGIVTSAARVRFCSDRE